MKMVIDKCACHPVHHEEFEFFQDLINNSLLLCDRQHCLEVMKVEYYPTYVDVGRFLNKTASGCGVLMLPCLYHEFTANSHGC